MAQNKMTQVFTLFPNFVALVPYESIAGDAPTITTFADIDKTNSFVLNDASSDSDFIVSEDGLEFTYTKTSEEVMAFDAGGVGAFDDVTIERNLTINIGVNGYSHDIMAILMGLDPKTDIEDNFKFSKSDVTGVSASGVRMQANITKKKFFFIARIPLDANTADGDLYICSPRVVVADQDTQMLMQNQKVTYTLPLKGLKLLNDAQLATLQTFAEPIVNGFELLYAWNAADVAYVAG